ncbi:MAG: hypothetical protein HYV26_14435 [Candidatus Hydrogenedentes bacterium]|nr:hypothetical protein [Candidatus Hydrogenedentota bacterium]
MQGMLLFVFGLLAAPASTFHVLDFGAVPGGEADCTAAFQRAIDAARDAGGGVVEVPAGRFRFDGMLVIQKNVALRGTYAYAPAHAGIRDKSDEVPVTGTVFEPHSGAGDEGGPPFIQLLTNAAIQGVTVHYPDQKPDAPAPTPYPWTIQMRGNNPAVIDVQLLNPYNGIDASQNQRALVRNVHGQPIHLGLFVDTVYDIGRIENVHWNPWWSINSPVYRWQMEHGTAFKFARTDWHYVLNTFCFGYHIGYHFTESEHGATNGNFLGIGADNCQTAVVVDETAPMAVLITNGEFVSFEGPDPTMVRVEKSHTGTIRFVNCAFWGPANRNAVVDGTGTVGFSDCTFMQWGHHDNGEQRYKFGMPSIEVLGGTIMIRGCEFMEDKAQVVLHEGVERAIIAENALNGAKRIVNKARGTAVIEDNVATPRGPRLREELDQQPGFRAHHRAKKN